MPRPPSPRHDEQGTCHPRIIKEEPQAAARTTQQGEEQAEEQHTTPQPESEPLAPFVVGTPHPQHPQQLLSPGASDAGSRAPQVTEGPTTDTPSTEEADMATQLPNEAPAVTTDMQHDMQHDATGGQPNASPARERAHEHEDEDGVHVHAPEGEIGMPKEHEEHAQEETGQPPDADAGSSAGQPIVLGDSDSEDEGREKVDVKQEGNDQQKEEDTDSVTPGLCHQLHDSEGGMFGCDLPAHHSGEHQVHSPRGGRTATTTTTAAADDKGLERSDKGESGYKGVTRESSGRWRARGPGEVYIGTYDTAEEAAIARRDTLAKARGRYMTLSDTYLTRN